MTCRRCCQNIMLHVKVIIDLFILVCNGGVAWSTISVCIHSRVHLNVLAASKKPPKFDPVTPRISHECWHAVVFLLIDVFFENTFLWGYLWDGLTRVYYPKEFGALKYKTSMRQGAFVWTILYLSLGAKYRLNKLILGVWGFISKVFLRFNFVWGEPIRDWKNNLNWFSLPLDLPKTPAKKYSTSSVRIQEVRTPCVFDPP